jgi:hypothetical protein
MSARTFLSVTLGASAVALTLAAGTASAQIRITEWMYNPVVSAGEFVELTNMGASAVNFAGYSYDDDSRIPGVFSLAGFGLVQAGESVVFTEMAAADFRLAWGLSSSVKVLGGVTNNLGRNDEINIFNGNTLVDRLTYGDQNFPGTLRTQGTSGRPGSAGAIGANNPALWLFSVVGDVEGSIRTNGGQGDIGSPGFTSFAPSTTVIPVPGAALLMTGGLALIGFAARRRSAR